MSTHDTIRPATRAKFERLGLAFVRQRYGMDGYHDQENAEAQHWVVEQDRKQARQQRIQFHAVLWLTFLGTVAACIAAWPVVKEWMGLP